MTTDAWITLAVLVVSLTVLAFDLRGHGESNRSEGGEVSYGGFDTEAWAATSHDVEAAVAYLRSPVAPVQPARIALVGSSIGSTAVVRAAALDPSLDVLVLLSPGRAYRGVDGILPAVPMGPPSLPAGHARPARAGGTTARGVGGCGGTGAGRSPAAGMGALRRWASAWTPTPSWTAATGSSAAWARAGWPTSTSRPTSSSAGRSR